jgi:hypothetical protein
VHPVEPHETPVAEGTTLSASVELWPRLVTREIAALYPVNPVVPEETCCWLAVSFCVPRAPAPIVTASPLFSWYVYAATSSDEPGAKVKAPAVPVPPAHTPLDRAG